MHVNGPASIWHAGKSDGIVTRSCGSNAISICMSLLPRRGPYKAAAADQVWAAICGNEVETMAATYLHTYFVRDITCLLYHTEVYAWALSSTGGQGWRLSLVFQGFPEFPASPIRVSGWQSTGWGRVPIGGYQLCQG